MKARKFIPLLVIAAGIWAYHNSLRTGFVFDDQWHITENPRIRQLWPLWEIFVHSSRPVVQLSLAVNYALGRLNPWGYHLFNVGVHILAGLALYEVARLTFGSEALRPRVGEAAGWLAAVISLIWLVHPLQTESVTYTIQRSESLMGLFYLLTLYCVIRSSGGSRSGWPRHLCRGWWQAGAVASCALGTASKPIMVTAPVVVFLYDRAFLTKSWREVMGRRWTLYACLAATWLLLPLLLANAPSEWKDSAGFYYKGIPPVQYALTQTGVILHYLRLAFWPRPLCLDYGWQYGWPVARTVRDVRAEIMVIGALLVATVWAWRRNPALGFLGVWFFIILAPTSSFVPIVDLVVEHRMYLPLAAVITMTVIGAYALGKRLFSKQQGVVLGCVVGGSVAVLLTFLTIQRNRDYNSEVTIWQDTVEKRPNNPRAHNNLGYVLIGSGRMPAGIKHLEQALQIKPDYAEAHNNLGGALVLLGKLPEAIVQYQQALQINPESAEVHNNLGYALIGSGRMPEGIKHLEQALQINPKSAEAHYNLANALLGLGKVTEAITHYRQSLQIDPKNAGAHSYWGAALIATGKSQEAMGHLEQALRIEPDRAEAQNNLAWLLATLPPAEGGDPVRAVGLAQRACELSGNRAADELDTLAVAYAAAGRFSDAIDTAQKAIDLARSAGQAKLVGEMEARLQLYRGGHVYRQSTDASPRIP